MESGGFSGGPRMREAVAGEPLFGGWAMPKAYSGRCGRRAPDWPCAAGALEDQYLCGRASPQWHEWAASYLALAPARQSTIVAANAPISLYELGGHGDFRLTRARPQACLLGRR